jgi:predicted ATP-dependent serine protease
MSAPVVAHLAALLAGGAAAASSCLITGAPGVGKRRAILDAAALATATTATTVRFVSAPQLAIAAARARTSLAASLARALVRLDTDAERAAAVVRAMCVSWRTSVCARLTAHTAHHCRRAH